MADGLKKAKSKAEALDTARLLVQEAVDVANKAGINPASVVAPHCSETIVKRNNGDGHDSKNLIWCGVPVIVDNNTDGLFEMPVPDDDLEQQPAFLVTQSTANFVRQDFQRYEPSLERMVENWQEEKKRFMQEQANRKKGDKKSVRRLEIKHLK